MSNCVSLLAGCLEGTWDIPCLYLYLNMKGRCDRCKDDHDGRYVPLSDMLTGTTALSDNSTLLEAVLYGHPPCDGWTNNTEGAFYHLGNTVLFLEYMGGNGAYGCLFIFGFQMLAFTCLALWGWMTMCGVDVFSWNLLLLVACVLQICHLIYRLQQDGLTSEELSALYSAVYRPMDVPVQVFQDIVGACENSAATRGSGDVHVEGKTPIEIRVSLDGQFLHYIFPHKFMDSPEWESLQPNEEGNFQMTLTAEMDCRYISWRRRRLYMLLSKERYIASLFSVMLGSDIADKLYSLNDKLFAKSGVRLDIRLPSLYQVLAPSSPGNEGEVCNGSGSGSARDQQQWWMWTRCQIREKTPTPSAPTSHQPSQRQPSDMEMPSGEENAGTVPMRYQRGRAPLAPTDTHKL
ncbi:hypothetical protein J4Q44_G00196680 [Coregonus suidteri]|uniref:POPDC1-3 domain-containing protein n=1 Tax=Coregonus suidteri TaxID=861788 RepID=A0AAN8R2A3_9TELE